MAGSAPLPEHTQAGGPVIALLQPRLVDQQTYSPPLLSPRPLSTRPDPTRFWRIFAILLGLVVLCAGVFAVWTVGATTVNGIKRMAVQIQTRVPLTLPDLPRAPEPNGTAAPYEPSPWPTPTGEEVLSTPAPDWQRYLNPECSAALDHLRAANSYLSDHPTAPFDADWRDDLSAAVSEMKIYCATIETASPVPNLVQEAHRNLTLATEEYDQANQLFKEGINDLNPGKVIEAAQHLLQAGKYLDQALDELNKIGK